MSYSTPDGSTRSARIAGDGTALLDTTETDRTILEWVREVHLSLAAGKTGEWILAITGIVLLANLIYAIYAWWPRRDRWRDALNPRRPTAGSDPLRSWFRTVDLVGAAPAFVVIAAATVIFFEHSIEGPIGAPPIKMPAVRPQGDGAGFAAVARAAEAAIPGSRFVGSGMPSAHDATYYAWLNEPGEFFREDGYGGSLVAVNGNDASVRGIWPLKQASTAYKFMALPYPVHTGEIAGPIGRFLVLLIGFWLAAMTIMGLIILNRRRMNGSTVGDDPDVDRQGNDLVRPTGK